MFSLKTRKGGLGKNERPGGLKTRKGDPGKNKGHAKENIYSRWIENPKGRFRQKLGIQKKKKRKEKYTQKKSNDYLKGEFERYLGSVQKWRLFAKLRSIGLYPEGVLVKGLYPDNVCIFSSDIIPIQSYQVFVL